MVLMILRTRLRGELPDDLRLTVETQEDLEILKAWAVAILNIDRLDALQATMVLHSQGSGQRGLEGMIPAP
jgi:hypothetical protein